MLETGESDRGAAVVAPPHPLYGGTMSNPVVRCLATVLASKGWATSAFDWRGVGHSQGRPSGSPECAVADYSATLRWIREARPGGGLVAAGYSFGALAAILAAAGPASVDTLLLVAPPIDMLPAHGLDAFEGRLRIVVGAADDLASPASLVELADPQRDRRIEVIPDEDHFFSRDPAGLERVLLEFLEESPQT